MSILLQLVLELFTSEKFGPALSDLLFAPLFGQLPFVLLTLILVKLLNLLGGESRRLEVVLAAGGSLAGGGLYEPLRREPLGRESSLRRDSLGQWYSIFD